MATEPEGAPAEGDDPFLGTVVAGRYRLLEKIGEGGAGAVYRGVHEALRKPVAVKLLGRAARADREGVARFEREAVAAANLKHPSIVEATDFGQLPDGTLFLVMEYVQGSSLRALLKDGRLPPARVLHVLRQVCAAVAFAHGREVVHRDLKPENVIVYDQGELRDLVKVIDFGIARMKSSFGGGPSGLTQVGTVVGTVEYMAPEQAMAQAVDARADQYSLGVIAFEMFTGRAPYVAEDVAQLIYMHVGAPIPRVTDLVPDLPRAVDDVLARMLGKLPDERFPTLSDAMTALSNAFASPGDAPSAVMRSPAVPPSDGSSVVTQPPTPFPQTDAPSGIMRSPAALAPPDAPSAVMRSPVSLSQPASFPQSPYGQPMPPLVTPSGTIVVGPRPNPPGAPQRDSARKRTDLLILLVSVIVSLIGLTVILVIILRDASPSPSSSDPGVSPPTTAPPVDTGPTLAPTSHEPVFREPPPQQQLGPQQPGPQQPGPPGHGPKGHGRPRH
jgi:serine/threonine-protein kinase